MSNGDLAAVRTALGAVLIAATLFMAAIAGPLPAQAGGACALVPNERMPSEKILQCGDSLTVRAAEGARYQPLYKKGDPLPVAVVLVADMVEHASHRLAQRVALR